MIIEVQNCDWGNISVADIEILLNNVAEHLTEHLRAPFTGHIRVKRGYPPKTLIRKPPGQGPIPVQLAVRDSYWAQFAYQFAHEFCHVLTVHERLWGSENMWFHEALCELASVFVLRRMGETWRTSPPYPGRTDYAPKITKYSDSLLANDRRQLPKGIALAEWLGEREDDLRASASTANDGLISDAARDQYAVVAYQLLPIFEAHPQAWNTVSKLPNSQRTLPDYLIDWYRNVDPRDRAYIGCIMERFSENPQDCRTRWGLQIP